MAFRPARRCLQTAIVLPAAACLAVSGLVAQTLIPTENVASLSDLRARTNEERARAKYFDGRVRYRRDLADLVGTSGLLLHGEPHVTGDGCDIFVFDKDGPIEEQRAEFFK